MATKHIIARGIGFTPGSVKFIVTHGFVSGVAVVEEEETSGGSTLARKKDHRINEALKREADRRAKERQEAEKERSEAKPKKQRIAKPKKKIKKSLDPEIRLAPQDQEWVETVFDKLWTKPGQSQEITDELRQRDRTARDAAAARMEAAIAEYQAVIREYEENLRMILADDESAMNEILGMILIENEIMVVDSISITNQAITQIINQLYTGVSNE